MSLKFQSVVFLGLITIFFSCSQKVSFEGNSICSTFYDLNKGENLFFLEKYQILETREYSIYNNSNRRNDRIPISIIVYLGGDNNIIIPSYPPSADILEKELFYNRCDSLALNYIVNKYNLKDKKNSLFKYYQIEIDSIYQEYFKIEVPKSLPYNNIAVVGYGNYIEFKLKEDKKKNIIYKCFLVTDSLALSQHDRNKFSKLPRFNNVWYYQIIE